MERGDDPNLDPQERDRFAAHADRWWDERGPHAPLHRLNPVRIAYLRERCCAHFDRDATAQRPLAGLRLLDVGCGGGLVCEPMTRLGASCLGVDADGKAVAAAKRHAARCDLDIAYRCDCAEALIAEGLRFDIVLGLEIIEHVPRPAAFIAALAALLEKRGMIAVSTLNRTAQSWLSAILGAEIILGWLPRGTHDWHQFVTPDEAERAAGKAGLIVDDVKGFVYDPLFDAWRLSDDLGVNYIFTARKFTARKAPSRSSTP